MTGALFALTLAFSAGAGCELDQAQVTFIPPTTARVLVTSQCGAITCWERYLVVDGQRAGESRACEVLHGDKGSPITASPVGP